MKKLLGTLTWLVFIFFLLIFILSLLAVTDSGIQVFARIAQKLSPDLHIEGLEGSLSHEIKIKQLDWKQPEQDIHIRQLYLKNSYTDLEQGIFTVQNLTADQVTVRLPDRQDDSPAESLVIALPLDIEVKHLFIRQLIIQKGEIQQQINNIQAVAHTQDGSLQIESLTAQPIIEQQPLAINLSGNASLNAPYNADSQLNLHYHHPIHGTLKGSFQLKGNLEHYRLSGGAKLHSKKYHDAQLELTARGSEHDLIIQKLTLNALQGQATGKVKLNWKNADKLDWDVVLQADKLNLASIAPEFTAPLSSQFRSQGTLKAGKAIGTIKLNKLTTQYQKQPVSAQGDIQLKGNTAEIKRLKIDGLQGTASIKGSVNWEKAMAWDIALNTEHIHSETILPDLPAVLSTKLLSKGQFKQGKLATQIDLQALNGSLQGYPLKGKGKIDIQDKTIKLDGVELSSGRNTLFVDGQAGNHFDIEWKLAGNKLSQLYKGLSGTLNATGKLQGHLEKLKAVATLKGKSLRFQDIYIHTMNADISQQQEQTLVTATINQLKTAGENINKIAIDGKGSIKKHRIKLKLKDNYADINLTAQGGWDVKKKQWQGNLQNFSLNNPDTGKWQLSSAVSITANQQRLHTGKLCLKNRASLVCSTTDWQNKAGLTAKGTLQHIPLSLFKKWLPKTVNFAGEANADFNIKNQTGTAKLALPDSYFTLKPEKGRPQKLQYQQAQLNIRLNGNKVHGDFAAHIVERGDISANAVLTLAKQASQNSIKAKINLDMPDIAWANRLMPDIQQLKGKIKAQINLSGLLNTPKVSAKANLMNASFSLVETGTNIQHINLNVVSQKANQANITGSLQSGKGKLAITGTLSGETLDNWQANVRLQGNQLDFMDTYEVKSVVSPNLTMKVSPKTIDIAGTLSIPETTIKLNELPKMAIYESDDVVILGKDQPRHRGRVKQLAQSRGYKIHPNISVIIGDKVSFSGFGLKTKLSGKFRIREQQQALFAQGSLKITDGLYKAYGQDLKITRGRLVFNGPVDNPGMDIKAIRKLPNIEAGIHLTGTMQQPKTMLFSNPPLSQTDILSYLLTGRKLSETSGNEGTMLLNALTSLGVTGGEGIARSIGTSLGLDTVNLNSDKGLESSELELGKRLGPNLYLKYIVGLFDSLQHIVIEYRINKRLTLEAQSGINQGFDLIYRMEKE